MSHATSALQRRTAFSITVSRTGCTSVVDRLVGEDLDELDLLLVEAVRLDLSQHDRPERDVLPDEWDREHASLALHVRALARLRERFALWAEEVADHDRPS